jgi:hypothetical protein
VADSPAYLTLSPLERGVLFEILRRFNGYNNGDIAITYEELGERLKGLNSCRLNNGRIALAVAKLWEHGLIDEPTEQSWAQRRARRYRLTFITSGKAPPYRQATNEYLKWTRATAKKDRNVSSPPTAQSGEAPLPMGPIAGNAQSPRGSKNCSFPLDGSVVPGDAGSLVICKPYQSPEKGDEVEGIDPVTVCRHSVANWWRTSGKTDRIQLAKRNGLQIDELLGFVNGSVDLPFPKAVALRACVRAAA